MASFAAAADGGGSPSTDRAVVGDAPAREPAILCLMGPTGTGKSELALRLADSLPIEIVSVDSATIYRGMDIGTNKPSQKARQRVRHHLIDIRDPAERYSAGEFVRDAERAVAKIRARRRIPVLVGGTFLYFRALSKGLAPLPPADEALRSEIRAEGTQRGWVALHRELARADATTAARIHVNDRQRIERALEILRLTGEAPSRLSQTPSGETPERFLKVVLWPPDRSVHREKLAVRFRAMLARGLVDEVKKLHARGDITRSSPAIRSLGYRQLWAWLEGECEFEEAVAEAIVATQRYAKRQRTWLRSETGLFAVEAGASALKRVLEIASSRPN